MLAIMSETGFQRTGSEDNLPGILEGHEGPRNRNATHDLDLPVRLLSGRGGRRRSKGVVIPRAVG